MIFIQVIVILIVCGIAWKFLSSYVDEPFKSMIVVVAVFGFCIWLLKEFKII